MCKTIRTKEARRENTPGFLLAVSQKSGRRKTLDVRDCLPREDSFRAKGKEGKHTGQGFHLPSTLLPLPAFFLPSTLYPPLRDLSPQPSLPPGEREKGKKLGLTRRHEGTEKTGTAKRRATTRVAPTNATTAFRGQDALEWKVTLGFSHQGPYRFPSIRNHVSINGARAPRSSRRGQDALAPGGPLTPTSKKQPVFTGRSC